ncbi:MAG: hypothetical protein AAFU57_08485 [Bacteroidota bacterium]
MKKYNRLLSNISLLFFGLANFFAFSQSQVTGDKLENPVDELFSETPDITQFHQLNFLPAKLYTGRVDVEIPIYEVQCGDITVPISIQYNTSGNKLDDLASRVGLGWSLNAGGSIAHVVKGLPDSDFFIFNGKYRSANYDYDNQYTLDAIGYHRRIYDYDDTKSFYNQRPASWINGATPPSATGSIVNNQLVFSYDIDSSPDLYHVAAPGLNAKFMVVSDDAIDPDGSTVKGEQNFFNRAFRAVFLDDASLKMDDSALSYSIFDAQSVLYTTDPGLSSHDEKDKFHEALYIDHFKITNAQGLIYEFRLGNVSETDSKAKEGYLQAGTSARNFRKRVDSWKLHSITNPVTNKVVEFEYEVYQISTVEEIPTANFHAYGSNSNGTTKIFEFLVPGVGLAPKADITRKVYPRITRLKRILFDKGEVEFKYGFNRTDGFDNKALSEVIVRNLDGDKVEGYRLVHDYFQPKETNCTGPFCKRLKLTELRVVDKEEDPADHEVLKKYIFTYNEQENLPMSRFSYEKDYMGYYNKTGVGYFLQDGNIFANIVDSTHLHPKLYFYPLQEELSILPFKKLNVTNTNNYRETAPTYGRTLEPDFTGTSITSLTKITYPTGGSLQLEYENNEFFFEGNNYSAPGLRVKKQTLDDGKGNLQEYTYNYKQQAPNNNSSGSFVSMPVYGMITHYVDVNNMPPVGWDLGFDIFSSSPKYYDALTQNSLVGYSRVEEVQTGNGKTVYHYTSPDDEPNGMPTFDFNSPSTYAYQKDYLLDNSAFPGINFIDRDIKRGKLTLKEVFNENNQLEYEEILQYQYIAAFQLYASYFEPTHLSYVAPFMGHYDFDRAISDSFSPDTFVKSATPINVERNLNTSIERKYYFDAGTTTNKESLLYDTIYPFPYRKSLFVNGANIETIDYTYSFDLGTTEMNRLTELNMIGSPVQIKTEKDGGIITVDQTFTLLNNFPFLQSLTTKKDQLTSTSEVTFDEYDTSNGNILQYSNMGEISTAVIWGYDKTYPVAKVENATYAQVASLVANIQTLSDADNDRTQGYTGNEGALRQALDNLRASLPLAMVTTFTYDPLIGITSITDPRGYTTYYEYDDYNRLVSTKDANGHLLTQNEYHYKGQ